MRPIGELMPFIMPYAPGCPEPSAYNGIRRAAIEFCETTRLWRGNDSIAVTPDSCNVVCAPCGAVLYEIESAQFNAYPLEAVSIPWLDEARPQWRDADETDGPRWITQTQPDTLTVVPPSTGTLKVRTTLRPSDDAEELPDFLLKHYSQVLADGALREILMIPGKQFSNPQMAVYYGNRFDRHLGQLSNANIKGQQRAPTRARPHWF